MPIPDRYTCEEVFRRLDDYLDRELAAAEVAIVRQHLEVCAVCASEYRFESSVLEQVRAKLRRIAVPADLCARIAAAIETEAAGGGGGAPRPS
jgi:anti-sigma factor (TIGR02949 family)